MYTYKAKVVKVVDGDTLDLVVDLGFKIYHRLRVRLARINTPELKGETLSFGVLAKTYLENLVPIDSEVTISTGKTDKYGRWIAEVYDLHNVSVNQMMLDSGLAVEVYY